MNKRYYQKPVIEVVQIQSHTLLTQTSLTINRKQPHTVEELEEEGLTPDTDGYLWGEKCISPTPTAPPPRPAERGFPLPVGEGSE